VISTGVFCDGAGLLEIFAFVPRRFFASVFTSKQGNFKTTKITAGTFRFFGISSYSYKTKVLGSASSNYREESRAIVRDLHNGLMTRFWTSIGHNTKMRATVALFTSKNANISRALFSFLLLQSVLIGFPCRCKALWIGCCVGRFSVVLLGDSSPPDASLTAMIAVFVLNLFLSLLLLWLLMVVQVLVVVVVLVP